MRRNALGCLFFLAMSLFVAACGSSGGGDTPGVDGDKDSEALADGDTDSLADGDTDTEADTEGEAAAEADTESESEREAEAEGEGEACVRAAGYYAVTGSCNTSYFSMPNAACVLQDAACGVDLAFDTMYYEGSIAGRAFSVTSETAYGTMTCSGTRGESAIDDLACKLPSAGVSCTGTATPLTLPDTTKVCCNVMTQDCPDSSAERCQIIGQEDSSRLIVAACIANDGSAKLGEVCTRTGTAYKDVGRDTCEKGLFCSLAGSPDADRRCIKYCQRAADCELNQDCASLGSVPSFGTCQKRCDPLGDASECGSANLNSCVLLSVISGFSASGNLAGFCYKAGTKAENEACSYADDCTLGFNCYGGKCTRMCNTETKPCAEGFTCTPLSTIGEEVGVCLAKSGKK